MKDGFREKGARKQKNNILRGNHSKRMVLMTIATITQTEVFNHTYDKF